MMKKLIALCLAALLLFSCAACGSGNTPESSAPTPTQAASVPPTAAEPVITMPAETEPPETRPVETEPAETAPAETVPTPAEIEAAIAEALGEGYLCTVDVSPEDPTYGALGLLDLSRVQSWVAKHAAVTAVFMDTVVIAACDKDYAEEAVDLFNQSYAQTHSYIQQYPFGVAKVEGARLYKVGSTVMLIIAGASGGPDITAEEEAALALEEYGKIDAALEALFGTLPENLIVIPEDSGDEGGRPGGLLGG